MHDIKHIEAKIAETMKFYVFDSEPKVIVQALNKRAAMAEVRRRGINVFALGEAVECPACGDTYCTCPTEYDTYFDAHHAAVMVIFANGVEV